MSKRRPNGDGMVRKRPDGRWEARIIVWHKEDGKPIYKSVFGKTQSEAMTKFYKLLETYRGVELNEDCLVNLNEWLDRWLCYQKDVVRPQTLNKYIFYADAYVRPYLGDKKISAILTRDMQQLYVKLLKEGRVTESKTKGKSLSGSTVRAVHMMMHKCFEMAVEQHIIVKNPTDGTTIPALNSTERKVYNEEQLKKFLKIIENEPWWRDFFYLECMTGLRKGEICGLRWEDLNEAEGKLSVARQVIPVRGGITVSDPKTDTGIRTIVLPESVVRMLKALKETVQKPVVKTAADMPFGEYIDYWYRNFCELSIAATTRLKYENDIYKHIIPGIGKIPLAALKKSDLEKFYAEQMKSGNLDRNGVGDKKLSGAVIRSMHTRIKCALDQALKEGLINRNEAIGCKLPPKKNKEIEVLSHEEIARLLIQAKEEGFYELILLGLATGMRRGELLGLKWDDINFTTGELSIRREYTTLGSDYKLLLSFIS